MNYSRRRFINIASIGLVSSAINHKIISGNGGRDRKDGTNVAGTFIIIHNNTFKAPEKAVVIRGELEEQCDVYQNWFLKHNSPKDAVYGYERTNIFDNLFGDHQLVHRLHNISECSVYY